MNGMTGAFCNEWCIQATAIFTLNLVTDILALLLFIVSTVLLFGIMRRGFCHRGQTSKFNSVSTALLFTSAGSVGFIITSVLASITNVGFPSIYTTIQDERTGLWIRRAPQSLQDANLAFFALSDCILICSTVVLPLTWVSLINYASRCR
jgi:hypothetical protein